MKRGREEAEDDSFDFAQRPGRRGAKKSRVGFTVTDKRGRWGDPPREAGPGGRFQSSSECSCNVCAKSFGGKAALSNHQRDTGHHHPANMSVVGYGKRKGGREARKTAGRKDSNSTTGPRSRNKTELDINMKHEWLHLPLTEGQERYDEALKDNAQLVCVGPAGSGKTMLAIREGLRRLERREVRMYM
jgi:DNA replication protein DnaC